MNEGFLMTARTGEVFYRTCKMYHITDYTDRIALMRKLVARKKVKYIRDGQEFLKGKKVLHYKETKPTNENKKELES